MKEAMNLTDLKNREKRLISPLQRRIGLVMIVLGCLALAVGLFGYLAGDWQIPALSGMTDQVFIAREVATSAGTGVTGAFDMNGEESGVHVFYASLSGADDSVLNVSELESGETKKALKGGSLQFPATKERMTLVLDEEQPIALDNGVIIECRIANAAPHYGEEEEQWVLFEHTADHSGRFLTAYNRQLAFYVPGQEG